MDLKSFSLSRSAQSGTHAWAGGIELRGDSQYFQVTSSAALEWSRDASPCLLRGSLWWWCWRGQWSAENNVGTDQSAGWLWPSRQHQGADGHEQTWHFRPSTDEAGETGQKDRIQLAWLRGKKIILFDKRFLKFFLPGYFYILIFVNSFIFRVGLTSLRFMLVQWVLREILDLNC